MDGSYVKGARDVPRALRERQRPRGWNVSLFRVNPNGVDLTLQESSHLKFHSSRRQGLDK